MKHRYLLLFFIGLFVFGNKESAAQMVGANIFFPGHWVEVGQAANGSFGPGPAPAGYFPCPESGSPHPTPGGNLAMVYDYDHDGWSVGAPPYFGDYVYPGTPFEGWGISVNGARSDAYFTDGGGAGYYNAFPAISTFSGNNVSYTNSGGIISGVWQGATTGTSGGLSVRQTTRLDTNASWVVVTTVLTNTSAIPIPDIFYERTCDPDDDVVNSGSYVTTNIITHQNDIDHRVMAGSYGTSYHNAYLALATKDCRAKAIIYQDWPPPAAPALALDSMYNGTVPVAYGPYYYALNATTVMDIAIGLIYKLGTLAPGDSTILSYAYIFMDSLAIDSAFPEPLLVVNGTAIPPTGPAPAPTIDTFNTCSYPGVLTFPVNIKYADDKCWSWSTWTWSPAMGLASTTGVNNTINIAGLSGPTTYTITGTDSAQDMYSCNYRVMYLTVIPCFNATSNSPGPPGTTICMNETLILHANGDSTGATYFWYGPAGFTAFTQYTSRTPLTMADTGTYYVVRTVGGLHDTAHTRVFLKALPIVTATSNAPICSGTPNTLLLFANPDSLGETFNWTGPNGFASVLQNPTIPNPPVANSGIYKVVTHWNGCNDSAIVAVAIDSTPALPTISSNTPLCSSHPQKLDTLKLFSSDVTFGSQYVWAGPGGFVSSLQNPTIPNVHVPASGTYTVTVSVPYDGITCSNTNTTVVVVDSTPYMPVLGSNAPICSGQTLLLTATSTDLTPAFTTTYSWTGPDAFTSGLQNPTISPATTLATGVYTVTATIVYPGAVCTSDTATLIVVVDSTPQVPGITSNSPGPPSICQGDTLFLYSSDSTASVGYSWSGPNTFTSTLQNPYIYPVTPAATGVYTVTAILGMCNASAVTTVSITPTPVLTATNNGPVCTGVADTLFLQAASNPGTTFSWTGPYTFVSSAQNPSRTPVIMEYGGIYQVISYLNGCPSLPVNDTVIVRLTPPAPWVSWLTFCQYYDANRLQAFGDSILWYPTSTPVGGTLTAPIPPTASDTVMWFYVTQTKMSCMSALDSFKVTINPKPIVTVSPSIGVCPHDTAVINAVDTDPIAYYHWAPSMYLSDTVGPSVIVRPETDVTYTVVATNKYGCTDTAFTNVSVKAAALLTINVGDSVILYPGETYQLDPLTNCSFFTWFPPAGLNDAYISNPVASPEISTKYIVDGLTSWGCKAEDSINIYVSEESLLALPNAFTPGNGPNNTFKILIRGIATLQYFRIFDRWGVKVFETTDISKGWDGTFNGTLQPFGVYVYEVGAVTSAGRSFVKHGNVTLIK